MLNTSAHAKALQRRLEVWKLRTQDGMTQVALAERYEVNQSTISRDLDMVAKQVASNLTAVATREKAVQIHQLQKVVSEAMAAYEKSKEPLNEVNREEEGELQDVPTGQKNALFPGATETEKKMVTVRQRVRTKVVRRVGSPVYLQTALVAMKDLRDLLGLEPPRELNINWKRELEDAGLDPSEVFEEMVNAAYKKMNVTDEGSDK